MQKGLVSSINLTSAKQCSISSYCAPVWVLSRREGFDSEWSLILLVNSSTLSMFAPESNSRCTILPSCVALESFALQLDAYWWCNILMDKAQVLDYTTQLALLHLPNIPDKHTSSRPHTRDVRGYSMVQEKSRIAGMRAFLVRPNCGEFCRPSLKISTGQPGLLPNRRSSRRFSCGSELGLPMSEQRRCNYQFPSIHLPPLPFSGSSRLW